MSSVFQHDYNKCTHCLYPLIQITTFLSHHIKNIEISLSVSSCQEFLWHRKHTYMRLDGSSKISDRRDMVAGFQSRWVLTVYCDQKKFSPFAIIQSCASQDSVILQHENLMPIITIWEICECSMHAEGSGCN